MERLGKISEQLRQMPGEETSFGPLPEISLRGTERHSPPTASIPEPPPAAKGEIPSTDSIARDAQEYWSQLMHTLKDKKPNLESYLKQSLWMTEERDVVRIGYPENSPFYNFLIKEETIKTLAEECKVIFRKPVTIVVVGVKESEKHSHVGPAVIPKRVEGISLVQKVQETLEGKIVEVKDLT